MGDKNRLGNVVLTGIPLGAGNQRLVISPSPDSLTQGDNE